MNLVTHAKRELELADLTSKDSNYNSMIADAVIALIQCFAAQGHSGSSASMVSDIFNKLSKFKPLTPLTGEHDEWNEVDEGLLQNNRCSHVFKNSKGETYDIYGIIFRDENGTCYTESNGSSVPIEFPYTPLTRYVDKPVEE